MGFSLWYLPCTSIRKPKVRTWWSPLVHKATYTMSHANSPILVNTLVCRRTVWDKYFCFPVVLFSLYIHVLEDMLSVSQELLLALCSLITLGRAWRILSDAENQAWVSHFKSKSLTNCVISPIWTFLKCLVWMYALCTLYVYRNQLRTNVYVLVFRIIWQPVLIFTNILQVHCP